MTFLAQHKLLAVLVVVALLIGGWYLFSGPSAAAPASTLTTTQVSGADPGQQTLVATLLTLRTVKLDGTIFNNPAFLGLKDFSTQIVPEPVGRPNPFAPLSATAAASVDTKGAQIFTPRH